MLPLHLRRQFLAIMNEQPGLASALVERDRETREREHQLNFVHYGAASYSLLWTWGRALRCIGE